MAPRGAGAPRGFSASCLRGTGAAASMRAGLGGTGVTKKARGTGAPELAEQREKGVLPNGRCRRLAPSSPEPPGWGSCAGQTSGAAPGLTLPQAKQRPSRRAHGDIRARPGRASMHPAATVMGSAPMTQAGRAPVSTRRSHSRFRWARLGAAHGPTPLLVPQLPPRPVMEAGTRSLRHAGSDPVGLAMTRQPVGPSASQAGADTGQTKLS